jgi:hypothetical protein
LRQASAAAEQGCDGKAQCSGTGKECGVAPEGATAAGTGAGTGDSARPAQVTRAARHYGDGSSTFAYQLAAFAQAVQDGGRGARTPAGTESALENALLVDRILAA